MNWRDFIDYIVGDKQTFTNKEVRDIVRKTLEYESNCWVNKSK